MDLFDRAREAADRVRTYTERTSPGTAKGFDELRRQIDDALGEKLPRLHQSLMRQLDEARQRASSKALWIPAEQYGEAIGILAARGISAVARRDMPVTTLVDALRIIRDELAEWRNAPVVYLHDPDNGRVFAAIVSLEALLASNIDQANHGHIEGSIDHD